MTYEIGARIRKYRKLQNMSQTEFAKKIGVSNSRVSNWEQGINRPSVDILTKICEVMNLSPDVLLDIRLAPEDMNEKECRVILAYRRKHELQYAVDILLGIEEVNKQADK